jgi:hypothetical protein
VDNYLFEFPWEDKVTAKYDPTHNTLSFCAWDNEELLVGDELFSIRYIPKNEQTEKNVPGKLLYTSDYGAFYYKLTDAGEAFGITEKNIESSFIILK